MDENYQFFNNESWKFIQNSWREWIGIGGTQKETRFVSYKTSIINGFDNKERENKRAH